MIVSRLQARRDAVEIICGRAVAAVLVETGLAELQDLVGR